jgi:hypothetical protein
MILGFASCGSLLVDCVMFMCVVGPDVYDSMEISAFGEISVVLAQAPSELISQLHDYLQGSN